MYFERCVLKKKVRTSFDLVERRFSIFSFASFVDVRKDHIQMKAFDVWDQSFEIFRIFGIFGEIFQHAAYRDHMCVWEIIIYRIDRIKDLLSIE